MLFSQDIGIDLGTANTLVFVKGKGIIIREPSVVAVDQRFNPPRVVAVGSQAKEDDMAEHPAQLPHFIRYRTALLRILTQLPKCSAAL